VSNDPGRQPRWPPLLKIENSAKNHLKIISSETAGPIWPKLWLPNFLFLVMADILVGGWGRQTQFSKKTIPP
jgi:hypothetical protein